MKKGKIIFHIDLNAFFCSVEEIKRPYLKNKPFAIGSRYSSKGVLSTANYVARKYGVGSAMNVVEALRKCPNLIIVDSNFDLYNEYSNKFINFLYKFSEVIQVASIDEVYMDVTDKTDNPLKYAEEIQNSLFKEIKLPCSIGIGHTLFHSKMASNIKKPMGITYINNDNYQDILYNLHISKIHGMGKKTYPLLIKNNINTIKDFIDNFEYIINNKILKFDYALDIINKIKGKSSDYVDISNHEQKSIGVSRTLERPLDDEELISREIEKDCLILYERLNNQKGYTLTVTIKYTNFKQSNRSKTFNNPLINLHEIIFISKNLFFDLWDRREVRLIGISISNFKKTERRTIFDIEENKLDETINNLQKKFGKNVIKKGL